MQFFSILKKTFIIYYEYLYHLVIFSLLWFIIITAQIIIAYSGFLIGPLGLFTFLVPVFLLGSTLLSGLDTINLLLKKNKLEIKKFFKGIFKNIKIGLKAFIFVAFFYFFLIYDLIFFINLSEDSFLFLFLTIIFLYLTIFFTMLQIYFWGLLVLKPETSFLHIIKNSFILTIAKPAFSFLWLLVLLIFLTISLVTTVGLIFFLPGLTAIFIIMGTKYVLNDLNKKREEK